MIEVIHSRAPFRISFAGGGSDVSPYSELYGGAVLNASIDLYAHCEMTLNSTNDIKIILENSNKVYSFRSTDIFPSHPDLELIRGALESLKNKYGKTVYGFNMKLKTDVPQGSGLGTSSTLLVCILGVLIHYFNIKISEMEIANLAFEIERKDLKLQGGKQDQYAAAIGGINFIEFNKDETVSVYPLNISDSSKYILHQNLVLYFSGESRSSSKIIGEQIKNVKEASALAIEATHLIKEQAYKMKEVFEIGNWNALSELLQNGWQQKKKLADSISNNTLEKAMEAALSAGAKAGKISGAGGGGFMFFYTNPEFKIAVEQALQSLGGYVQKFNFTSKGLETWTIRN